MSNDQENDKDKERSDAQETPELQKLDFVSILKSTLAAAFGVQSNKNRERDFQKGSIWVFIAAGIIFTLVFILTLLTLVRWVLSDGA